MLCIYGCNQEAKFKLKNGRWCCESNSSKCVEIKKKNSDGIKRARKEGKKFHVWDDTNRKNSNDAKNRNLKQQPFEQWGRKLKEDTILEEQNGKCLNCGIEKVWQNKPLTFELDHIDGNNKNNKRENLRFLCPNCHSQTPTWRGRGVNTVVKKVSDLEFLEAISTSKNRSQALNKLQLSGGDNYRRGENFQIIFLNELVDFSNANKLKVDCYFNEYCKYSFYKGRIIPTDEILDDVHKKSLAIPTIKQVIEWIKQTFALEISFNNKISNEPYNLIDQRNDKFLNTWYENEGKGINIIETQKFLWKVYDWIRVNKLGVCH